MGSSTSLKVSVGVLITEIGFLRYPVDIGLACDGAKRASCVDELEKAAADLFALLDDVEG